jgi:hypothetical protein
MQKMQCTMPAAPTYSSGESSREFKLQNDVAYGFGSFLEIDPTFPSPIRIPHSKRRGTKALQEFEPVVFNFY